MVMPSFFRQLCIGIVLIGAAEAVSAAFAMEQLVIAASPSVKVPLEALAHAFEERHPEVRVRIRYDSGLGLRQSIAAIQSSGRYFIGSGPVHLIAPASNELLDRLERRSYILPGTRTAYASVPLVLVVPESFVDAPRSFAALAEDRTRRLSIADPDVSELGLRTQSFLQATGLFGDFSDRLDMSQDAKGVIDHVLNGAADAGLVFASDAAREPLRIRIVARSTDEVHRPIVYSVAMDRYCANRSLCQAFLAFTQTAEAETTLKPLGYGLPTTPNAANIR